MGRDSIEPIPAELRAEHGLAGAADSLGAAHFPWSAEAAEDARSRLAFEELFLHQVALAARRKGREDKRPGIPLDPPAELTRDWLASLPFEPTEGQRQAFAEIDEDLASGRPDAASAHGRGGHRERRRSPSTRCSAPSSPATRLP